MSEQAAHPEPGLTTDDGGRDSLRPSKPGPPSLSESLHLGDDEWHLSKAHDVVVSATDAFFGGFCVLSLLLAGASWYAGDATWRAAAGVGVFLIANIVVSQLSLRSSRPYHVEIGRAVTGGLIAPLAYVLTDGPVAPFWPGFLIMCLGGSMVLGLLTGLAFWGRVLVAYYCVLMVITKVVFLPDVGLISLALQAGVVAMVGLLFAQIMSLLGGSIRQEAARARELQRARDALFAEVEVAHEIQTLLIPEAPVVGGHGVAGCMIPAEDVGGDYYDVIHTQNGRELLAIGDVSGHGVTSGLAMMMARSSLLGVLESRPDTTLTAAYVALNRCLCRNIERMGVHMFMTFNLLEHRGNGRFTAVGLHLPLLVYRADSGEVEELETDGMWLGLMDDFEEAILTELSFVLRPGDLLMLYTDGIVERFCGADMYGQPRLVQMVRQHGRRGAAAVVEAVVADLEAFSPEPASDDITMLVLDHRGSPVGA